MVGRTVTFLARRKLGKLAAFIVEGEMLRRCHVSCLKIYQRDNKQEEGKRTV